MSKTMTPSEMTQGQIDKAVGNYRAMLEKHAREFESDAVQTVLGSKEFPKEQFELFRKHVNMVSDQITRHVHVDGSLTPQEVIDLTGRNKYLDGEVVASMPKGDNEEVDVVFFKVGRYVTDNELEEEYEKRGLVPADPYSLLQANIDDPAFADDYPCGTHWKDENGKWCYAFCVRWGDGRRVEVGCDDSEWNDRWWFAGVRKS